MKPSAKILMLTAALVTATGAAVASQGSNCDQQGGMRGNGSDAMQGMQHSQRHSGMEHGQKRGKHSAGKGAIYQLDNLTETQMQQIAALRSEQQERMFNQREQMFQKRAEMKQKIHAILNDEQRAQLDEMHTVR